MTEVRRSERLAGRLPRPAVTPGLPENIDICSGRGHFWRAFLAFTSDVPSGGDWYGRRLGGSYGWWHNYKTDSGVGSAIELAAVGGRKQVIFSDSPLIYSQ